MHFGSIFWHVIQRRVNVLERRVSDRDRWFYVRLMTVPLREKHHLLSENHRCEKPIKTHHAVINGRKSDSVDGKRLGASVDL
jgi:hypothetical protein